MLLPSPLHTLSVLVVANHLPVAEEYQTEFVELFEERVDQTRGRSGLEKVEILRPVDGGRYVIQAYWQSRDAFDQWRNSEDFEAAHADLPAKLFTGANHLRIYDLAGEIGAEE